MSKKEISFTEGPVFQSLLRFAIPVLGALILQAAYGAVDLLIVGKFGNASSISAVGTGSSFMQMATFIITSLAMGSTVIIGHHIGEQKPKEAGNACLVSITLLVYDKIPFYPHIFPNSLLFEKHCYLDSQISPFFTPLNQKWLQAINYSK